MTQERSKWQVLAVTGLAVVLSMTTWFSATAVAPQMTEAWGLSAGQSGWLTNAVSVGFVTGALASSLIALSDRMSLIGLMWGAAVLAAIFNGAVLLEPGYGLALVLRFLTGAALAAIYPPAMKFIATWFRAGRGLAMGAMVGALALGKAMPHLLKAFASGLDWQVVVGATSVLCLASALIFARALHEGPYSFARTKVDLSQFGAILRNRPVMLANFGYFGHMWELYAMWGWILAFSTVAIEQGDWPLNASLLAFAVVALGAPSSIIAGALADRIGRCNTTALLMAASGASALLIGFAFEAHPMIFLVIALFWGFTVVADSAQFSAAVSELADQSFVGSSLAFQMSVGFAISIFTVWLVPQLVELTGSWRWSFLVLVPGPVFGAVSMLRLKALPEAEKLAGGKR
ncbi:MAG: MFS transporter [Silicimonas sp.]|nr:MFS transporter [Silicimonas sp.]